MKNNYTDTPSRRQFLMASGGIAAATLLTSASSGAVPMPKVRVPRATSGDHRSEPAWEKGLTLTVGHDKADIVGTNDKAIQAAVDYVARLGGGTVQVLPGKYGLRNSIFMSKGVRLLGSGDDSILFNEPGNETTLSADSDWFDQEITLKNADDFRVGDGIVLSVKNESTNAYDILRRTLVARSGNRFKLDKALRKNFWTQAAPSVTTRFPMITAEETSGFAVENIFLDGNKANNGHLNGNHTGGLWFQDCNDIDIKNVHVRDYNGDAISFQICHDVNVESCEIHNNTDLGIHPGSGSQRPRMVNNKVSGCGHGIFFCWGVKYGLAEANRFTENRIGISIGHHDDENLIIDNDIENSGKNGLLFRPERGEGFTAKGNRFENNRILNSGGDEGIAVDVMGVTSSNSLVGNTIKETRSAAKRIGIQFSKESGVMAMENNTIEGFSTAISDLRKA